MKRLTAMLVSLSLAAITLASANPAEATPASNTPALLQNAQEIIVTRIGSKPSQQGPRERFTGSVRIDPLFDAAAPSRMLGSSVTFAPGARTAWHTHPLGQTLIITAGNGLVQSWGGRLQEIRKGDVVRIAPGVKHWHGASSHAAMTHLSVLEELDGTNAVWMEQVSDAQYNRGTQGEKKMDQTTQQPNIERRRLSPDDVRAVAPALEEYTQKRLYGEVWKRPGLSARDRSLVTIAALIAAGQVAQIPYHLNRAMDNGLTQEQGAEVLTHLAFYVGWPNVFSALPVAKDVFEKRPK
jgi:4-carboxymuconolactone decarboxylase